MSTTKRNSKLVKLFGTDGIRGLANRDPITPELGQSLGRALVFFCRNKGIDPILVIGRDTRASGEMLEHAVVSGARSVGGEVYDLGEIPTPGVAYLTTKLGGGAGIVVSASHNSYEYNGFKVFSREGLKLSLDEEAEVESLIHSKPGALPKEDHGSLTVLGDAQERYISFLEKTVPEDMILEDMKIILDCANGATYQIAPALFERLNAGATILFSSPNGENINEDCGSQHTESLKQKVIEERADVGLAFDGDGDRLVAIDEKGAPLTGDQLLTICAKMLKDEGELKNNLVVSTIMSNMGFSIALKEFGIEQVSAKVGDRYVMEEMRAREANLGGEDSGHLIFFDYHTTGDGLLSALQVIRAIKTFNRPLSELSAMMKVFPQTLMNVRVRTKPKIENVPALVEEIERVESVLGDKGRVLVRYSGTEPVCRVMVEGEHRETIEKCANEIADVVDETLNKGNF
jgi:phosphoglucosamine mutase